jgi:hypothetical protein
MAVARGRSCLIISLAHISSLFKIFWRSQRGRDCFLLLDVLSILGTCRQAACYKTELMKCIGVAFVKTWFSFRTLPKCYYLPPANIPSGLSVTAAANYLVEINVRSAFHHVSTLRRSTSVALKLICDITPHINIIEA